MKLETRFPDLELSYETYAHKKVLTNYDVCLAIPTGKKVFAWFTYDADAGTNAVYFVELNKHFKVCKVEKTNIPCDNALALQTILYGTLTDIDEDDDVDEDTNVDKVDKNKSTKQFFIVEDVYYYKGLYTKHLCYGEKLYYLHSMFYNKLVSSMFALPYMCIIDSIAADLLDSLSFYESICIKTAYTTHHIQFRSSSSVMPYLNHTYKKKQEQVVVLNTELLYPHSDLDHGAQMTLRNAVFKVKADVQADVYHLYASEDVYVNIAYIGSIDSSKYMNSLFRNIRENANIDYGEESEDEDDFQNVNPDKYVDLSKTYFMNCVYHAKFKKWVPVNVVNTTQCVEIDKLIYCNQHSKKTNYYNTSYKTNYSNNKTNYTNNKTNYTNNKTNYTNNKTSYKSNNNYKSNNSTDTGYTPFHKYRQNQRA